MNTNNFAEWLVESMLSWSRWLADLIWGSFNAGGEGGMLNWFVGHWLALVVALIVVGSVVDWLVWMVRWRPYWLWFRRDQVVYAEAPQARGPAPKAPHFRGTAVRARADEAYVKGAAVKTRPDRAGEVEYYDPFAAPQESTEDAPDFDDEDAPFRIDFDPEGMPDEAPSADDEEDLWADAPPRPAKPQRPEKTAKIKKQPKPRREKAKKREGDFDWFDGEGGA